MNHSSSRASLHRQASSQHFILVLRTGYVITCIFPRDFHLMHDVNAFLPDKQSGPKVLARTLPVRILGAIRAGDELPGYTRLGLYILGVQCVPYGTDLP